MKKIVCFVFTLLMAISLSSCKTEEGAEPIASVTTLKQSETSQKAQTSQTDELEPITLDLSSFFSGYFDGAEGYPKFYLNVDSDKFAYVIDDLELSNLKKQTAIDNVSAAEWNITNGTPSRFRVENDYPYTVYIEMDYDYFSSIGIEWSDNYITVTPTNLTPATIIELLDTTYGATFGTSTCTRDDRLYYYITTKNSYDYKILLSTGAWESLINNPDTLGEGTGRYAADSIVEWEVIIDWDYVNQKGYILTFNGSEVSELNHIYLRYDVKNSVSQMWVE